MNKVNEAHRVLGSAVHPVVQLHPVSGRKFLYVNEGFTHNLVGLGAMESNRLLAYLYHHMQRPEYQVRCLWSKESMVIWDNRCACYYATADYLPQERIMHRITVVRDSRIQGHETGSGEAEKVREKSQHPEGKSPRTTPQCPLRLMTRVSLNLYMFYGEILSTN